MGNSKSAYTVVNQFYSKKKRPGGGGPCSHRHAGLPEPSAGNPPGGGLRRFGLLKEMPLVFVDLGSYRCNAVLVGQEKYSTACIARASREVVEHK